MPSPEPDVLIDVADERWREAGQGKDPEAMIAVAVRAALHACVPAENFEIGIRLTNDSEIQNLNRDWRGQDKATNVLSFALDDDTSAWAEAKPLGDIVVAFETCRREAEDENKTLAHHLSHMVVHGTLHLLGYDHEIPEEADLMEATEQRILAGLGIPDPYADSAAA